MMVSWVYDVNDDHSRSSLLLFLLLEFSRFIASSSSPRFTSSGKAAAASAREESFPCSFFKGIIKSGQRGDNNSTERVISLSFSFDDAKKDHPSLCFVLFRCSSFAKTHADDVFFSLTSSEKKQHQISSDF